MIEDVEALFRIGEPSRVVLVEHEDRVAGIRVAAQSRRGHRERVQLEPRFHGVDGRRACQRYIHTAREHAVLAVTGACVVGAELARQRRAERRRARGGQVPAFSAWSGPGDRYARQLRRASRESDLDRQPIARLSALNRAKVDQARIQPPAEKRQRDSGDLLYAAADPERHDAGWLGRRAERDLLATGGQRTDCQLAAVNEEDVPAARAGNRYLGRSIRRSLGR